MKSYRFLVLALVIGLALPGLALAAPPSQTDPLGPVFINEIHYDNTGTDTGEAIEVFGPAGADLTGWSLVLYNGSNGASYATTALSGAIPDQGNGCGTVSVSYASNGVQNGSPDGVALVNASSTVVQFLSYEGVFTATNGPANTIASTDMGVSEAGSEPVGQSLQLTGTGMLYGDFSWIAPSTSSFGAVNTGQTCGTVPPAAANLVINEIDYDQPGTDAAEFIEIKNNDSLNVNLDAYSVQLVNGDSGAVVYQTIDLPNIELAVGDYYVVCADTATVANCDLDMSPDSNLIQNGSPDAVALIFNGSPIDAVSYEGDTAAPYTEGSGAGLEDNAAQPLESIARCSDGGDTNQNNVDFSLRLGTPGEANNCLTDAAPTITSTTPGNGASGISPNGNLVVNFSEAVNVSGAWFDISCATSGPHTATVSGGPQTYTLDPEADFTSNESCTVTLVASQITDQDADDPPDAMDANYVFSFNVALIPVCGDPATFIHDIQGVGPQSSMVGAPVFIEGIVVGDYQATTQFRGFHVQEEDAQADGDAATSEGIFVFDNSFGVDVLPGDLVRIGGTVAEFETSGGSGAFLTELGNVTSVTVCSGGNSVTASTLDLPVSSLSDLEAYEGMLVTIPETLTVTETFTLGRFGEVSLSANGRLFNPTNIVEPGQPAIDQQDLNNRSRIVLDDGDNRQNIDPTVYPAGGLSALNTLRSGYTVSGLTGVLEQRFSVYRLQPVGAVSFNADNVRPTEPAEVGGSLHIAAMNVLNYFNGDGLGGGFPTPRGANTPEEFARQREKIINAILGLDADVVGLMEIENDAPPNSAIEDLVAGLNAVAGAGTYAYIDTGVIGTDAIKVALIYKPAVVTPVGAYAIIDSSVDPLFLDTKNRPSLAQTFSENATGAKLTVVVNHLKSKGSACTDVSDPDTGDGQGNCNLTRTNAATALVNWLATDPTGSGDPDFILIGDMNSYAKEDPIDVFKAGGFVNLFESNAGAYSYVFDGQSGYLDHALASASLAAQVTGATEWHVNADEPIALDYNVEFKQPPQLITFYDPGPYRSSDHDPLVVGMDLNFAPAITSTPVTTATQAEPYSYDVEATGAPAPTFSLDVAPEGLTIDSATGLISWTPLGLPGDYSVTVRASNGVAPDAVQSYTITVEAADHARKVWPILECVVDRGRAWPAATRYLARFGYYNPNDFAVEIVIGNKNHFIPLPQDRGQPTEFLPGRVTLVFEVPFRTQLVWFLDNRFAIATRSPWQRCP